MAAEIRVLYEDCRTKFQYLASKFASLLHGRSDSDRQQVNSLFDELNALDFKSPLVDSSDDAILIINRCTSIVPSTDTFLVAKGCQLISNLITKQHVKVEGKTLSIAIRWCTQSLKYCGDVAILDILLAFQALLRRNGSNVEEQMDELAGANGALTLFLQYGNQPNRKKDGLILASPWEVHLMAVECFESLVFPPDPPAEQLKLQYLEACAQVFLKQLYSEKHPEQEELVYCKVLIASLRGLQNILQQSRDVLKQLLGEALGMVKTYMLYGLQGYADLRPQQVFPANLFSYDIRQTALRDGTGGKSVRAKKRNLQRQKKSDSTTNRNVEDGGRKNHSSPISTQSFCAYTFGDSVHNMMATESSLETSLYPVWLKTSESDFSDTEAGQAAKNRVTQGRVRKSALSLLITVTKVCDRKLLFGYWSSLLPDGPNMSRAPTLCTSLLKDPSPHSRILVPQSLILMLSGSRLYLSQAEKSSKSSLPFTPFSVTVGNMVRELHQTLCLALAMENSIPVITQLLKCLAALVQNTPYHRLEPGLITRVVRNVKPRLRHKDSNVEVASLTVLGSIVAVQPSTPEITDVLCKSSISSRQKHCDTGLIPEPENKVCRDQDVETCQQPGSNQDTDYEDELEDGTDAFVDCISTDVNNQMSWLLEVCLRNLQPTSLKEGIRTVNAGGGAVVLPCTAPVRVECLQVLTVLARNYYTQVISSHIGQLMQVLGQTLSDGNVTICLHSGRVIEALGNSMQQCLQEQGGTTGVSLDKNLQFWQTILSGPLISLVQNAEQAALRAAGCDCLATIGTGVFEQLPRDKQILIVTLLFGCSHDEEIGVRSSALRALGVCVLFPTLREVCKKRYVNAIKEHKDQEKGRIRALWYTFVNYRSFIKDIHFIIDTADCVIRTLLDQSLLVRMKASWCLGNLSEALVLNSMADDIEDIPTELLLKLMEASIKVTRDNDKVRSCAVRAVGNFVRLITEDMMNKSNFREFNDKAITALVRNATTGNNMKVRWNACYAIGNTMRNSALYLRNSAWQNTVFTTIMNLVQDVRNFKVRISAAFALSVPQSRQQYGSYYITTWTALLNGLDNSENMEDFSEYKHRDNLLDQICLTMGHLASLATRDDLTFLHDILIFHLDTLKHHILKFHERVVPEKAGVLSAASSHATSLLQLQGLTSSQHSAATVLVSVFLQDPDLPLQYN